MANDGVIKIQVITNFKTASKEVEQFDTALKGIENTGKKTVKQTEQLKTATFNLQAAFKTIGGLYLGKQLLNIGASVSKTAQEMDALVNKFNAAAASKFLGAESLEYVRKLSDELGLSFQNAASGFAGFEAAALRAGLTFEDTKQVFADVSTASTSLQLSGERVSRVFTALEQIAGKGTVAMEEIRLQLADSLPGALSIAASAMNMTTSEFIKLVSEGKIASKDFLPAFGAEIKKQLGGSAVDAAQQARANFNRLPL